MSILIEGMEMPTSCFYCPFRRKINPDNIQCLVTRDVFEETFAGTIEMRNRGFCPLIEIPPHGRLIDANKVISDFEDGMEFIRSTCQNVEYKHLYCLIADGMIELLKKYRTVIPADKDGGT